jgi:PmbA protein
MRKSQLKKAKEVLLKALSRIEARGAESARLIFEQDEVTECKFDAGKIKSIDTKQTNQYTVEVVMNKKMGRVNSNDFNKIDSIIDDAFTLSKIGSDVHFPAYPPPGQLRDVKTHSEDTVNLPRERLISSCQAYVERMKEYDDSLHIMASAEKSESESLIINTGGVCEEVKETSWSLLGFVQRTGEKDILFAGDFLRWRDVKEYYDMDFIIQKTLEKLKLAEHNTDALSGIYPVILRPYMLTFFLYPLALGVNGKNVIKGSSPLKDRIGEQIFDTSLTVIDNPHLDFSNGSRKISREGIPTKRIEIVKEGILKNYLCDLDTASLLNVEPTGNDNCQVHHGIVPKGDESFSRMVSQMEEGIYIVDLIGFGQSNIINGDFSCNVGLGYRIQNGEIKGRIKNVMAAGNIYDILKQPVILSSDTHPTLGLPYAKVNGINFSASR